MFKIENLSYSYDADKRKALNDISFEIEGGSLSAIAGPVGSGKTTLALLLAGLLEPTKGRILFDGKVLGKEILQSEAWRDIGITLQQPERQIFESSVREELSFSLKNKKIEVSDEALAGYLELVGLDSTFLDRRPLELSGGEKRLIAIASAICYEPKVLIMDEPAAGLDANAKEMVFGYLNSVKGKKTIILISHDPDELLLADRLLLLREGQLADSGDAWEVIEKNFKENFLELPTSWRFSSALAQCGLMIPRDMSAKEVAGNIRSML